jgi:hypothetical protein
MGKLTTLTKLGRKAKQIKEGLKEGRDAGQKQTAPAVKGTLEYTIGQGKAGAGIALTAAVVGKMSLDEMRERLKKEKDEKNREILKNGITKALIEAKAGTPKTKEEPLLRPKARPKEKPMLRPKARPENMAEGSLVQPKGSQTGLKKLPSKVRNKMGYMNRGGSVKSGSTDMRKGGMFYK